jgi:hypothetical protein
MVRVLKSRYSALCCDLGDDLSYMQSTLAQRVIHLQARIEAMEEGMIAGKAINVGQYLNCINSLVGLARTLGIERRAKDVTLQDYIDDDS